MDMTRVCIYHVNQHHIGRAAAMCGEVIATMSWECIRSEVDIIAGDGNKAAYYATPKNPGVPTYECSSLQFWIDRMINTATQARIKNIMVFQQRSDPNTSSHVHTVIWCTLATTSQTSPQTSTQKNLQRRQKTMVIVTCSQCWNGAILAIFF